MSDALLASTDSEEALSRAYVAAVAAGAGYVTAQMDFDRDGVDVQIRAGGLMRPSLDIQLKATINLGAAVSGSFRYPLKRRNYDLLREQTMIPRVLVLLALPTAKSDWMSVTPEQLVIRRCAYWVSLRGAPPSTNEATQTIYVPRNQMLSVAALTDVMTRCSRREEINDVA